MRRIDKNRLQMFRRVRDILRAQPAAPELELNLSRLEGLIDQLTEEATRQQHHTRLARAGTTRMQTLARTLRMELMRPVARVGAVFLPSSGPDGATLQRTLKAPRVEDYEGVITTAETLARVVSAHEAEFEREGLTRGHAAKLLEGGRALRAAVDARGQELAKRVAATMAAREVTRDGARQVRILEALMEPAFREDASLRSAWRSATLVAGPRGGRHVDDGSASAGTPVAKEGGEVLAA
ncbi:MAG: hypothetical protein ABI910_18430 [Gemmatimonadota bacterium]